MRPKDPFAPLINRANQLSRDVNNMAVNVLTIFSGTKKVAEQREVFARELASLINQMAATKQKWDELESLLVFVDAHANEISERDLIKLVESASDTATVVQGSVETYRLAHIDCAMRMLQLDPELIPWAVKELMSYEGGPERMAEWRAAISVLDV